MTPNREYIKWSWPEFHLVFPIDFMLSVAIIGLMAGIALVNYSPNTFRAKFSEAWIAVATAKYTLIEQLALSGETVEIPFADATGAVSSVTTDDHLSGRKAVKRKSIDITDVDQAKKAAEENRKARELGGGVSQYVSSTRIVGNAIVISGTIDGRPYDFGVYPAVADEEAPAVYLWLCGRHDLPEGWLAQPPALSNPLPDNLLTRDCRRRRGT